MGGRGGGSLDAEEARVENRWAKRAEGDVSGDCQPSPRKVGEPGRERGAYGPGPLTHEAQVQVEAEPKTATKATPHPNYPSVHFLDRLSS